MRNFKKNASKIQVPNEFYNKIRSVSMLKLNLPETVFGNNSMGINL